MPLATTTICDFPVSRLRPAEMQQFIEQRAAQGQGGWVVTLNLEMLARVTRDEGYSRLLRQADWFTADGIPMVWASRYVVPDGSGEILERTTGVDLVNAMLKNPHGPGFAVIGGKDPQRTLALYPESEGRCGYLFNGQVDLSDEQINRFAAALQSAGVGVVFLALGVPKQDALAVALRSRYPQAVYLGIGGSFEMLAPEGKRAPRWMQQYGLEWAYRLAVDPLRLWRRYLIHYPVGANYLLRDILNRRKAS